MSERFPEEVVVHVVNDDGPFRIAIARLLRTAGIKDSEDRIEASIDVLDLRSTAGRYACEHRTSGQLKAPLSAIKVHHGVVNGKIFYAYKDEKKAVAYVGGEQEYQHYQQLAIAQQIASDNYQAAEMNQQMAMGWYGAWGYGSMGPGYFRLR